MKFRSFSAFAVVVLASLPVAVFAADDMGTLRADIVDAIAKLVSKYETRITELQTENDRLRAEISILKESPSVLPAAKPTATVPAVTAPASSVPSTKPAAAVPSPIVVVPRPTSSTGTATTGNASYDALIKSVVASQSDLFRENGLSDKSEIGLFEFVDGKNSFFISIDDGKNPAGVTAFKTKILFDYDAALKTKLAGTFDLDYAVSRYRTVFGANPYSTGTRTRIKNPSYKGKLFDEAVATASSTGSTVSVSVKPTAAPSSTPVPANVTAKDVRSAYDRNKIIDAIKLADAYLAKNPDDVEILTVRYRSLYMLSRFADSLKDVGSIERLQGAAFDCTIAKDAAFIAKSAKNAELAAKYGAMCKKR